MTNTATKRVQIVNAIMRALATFDDLTWEEVVALNEVQDLNASENAVHAAIKAAVASGVLWQATEGSRAYSVRPSHVSAVLKSA
jgi:hypothetical protein